MRSLERLRLVLALGIFAVCFLASSLARAYAGAIASSPDGLPGYVTSQAYGASNSDATPADANGGCVACHGTAGSEPTVITLNGTALPDGGDSIFTGRARTTNK